MPTCADTLIYMWGARDIYNCWSRIAPVRGLRTNPTRTAHTFLRDVYYICKHIYIYIYYIRICDGNNILLGSWSISKDQITRASPCAASEVKQKHILFTRDSRAEWNSIIKYIIYIVATVQQQPMARKNRLEL